MQYETVCRAMRIAPSIMLFSFKIYHFHSVGSCLHIIVNGDLTMIQDTFAFVNTSVLMVFKHQYFIIDNLFLNNSVNVYMVLLCACVCVQERREKQL